MALHCRDRGQGLPIVFIHGFCEQHTIWDAFVAPLENSFRILTVDLPGFGRSPAPATYTIDAVADEVGEWLTQTLEVPALVVGHSLGGYVGLSLAARRPELLKGLVLFHSSCFPDSDEKRQNRDRIIAFVKEHGTAPFVDTFVPGLFHRPDHPAAAAVHALALQTPAETIVGYSGAMRDRLDRSGVLKQPAIAKLIIAGRNDGPVPIAVSREMALISANYRYLELDQTGHMGFFEAPEDTRAAIQAFAGVTWR